jgi:hypothetical protein
MFIAPLWLHHWSGVIILNVCSKSRMKSVHCSHCSHGLSSLGKSGRIRGLEGREQISEIGDQRTEVRLDEQNAAAVMCLPCLRTRGPGLGQQQHQNPLPGRNPLSERISRAAPFFVRC